MLPAHAFAAPSASALRAAATAHYGVRVLGGWTSWTALLSKCEGHGLEVTGLTFLPGRKACVSASKDGTVRIWDMTSGQQRAVLEGHSEGVTCLAVSGNAESSNLIASGSADGTIRLWDPVSLQENAVLGTAGGAGE